jgi:heptosyltransferase III
MKIDWYKIKYVKGILPYCHKAFIYYLFLICYIKLWCKINNIKNTSPGREVVIISLLEHIGDIVASEPIVRHVRQNSPNAFIFWALRKPYFELVEYNSCVDEVLILRCLSEWHLLSKSGLFDKIIDLHFQNRECSICRRPTQKYVGNIEINVENYFSYGNLLAAYCQSAGVPIIDDKPQLYLPDKVVDNIDKLNLPESFLVIHCMSNETAKDWSAEKWRQLTLNIISEFDLSVVEIGLQPLIDLKSGRYVNLCGQLSLLETAEVIRRAKLFIGIDSGPAHLANAAGTFGIILLGEYRFFKRYMPYSGSYESGENAKILFNDGPAADIPVKRVYDAITEYLHQVNGGSE